MAPFRNDLDAADARKAKLAKELEEAEDHAAELRARQEGTEHQARKTSKARRWDDWRRRKKLLVFPLVVLGVFVALPAFGNLTASSCGYRAVVLDAVESCPEARALLGDDIHFGRMGMACGTTSINDDEVGFDYARWRMPISGSQSSGVYHFDAQNRGKGWAVHTGRIEVDGSVVDLSTCSAPARAEAAPQPNTNHEQEGQKALSPAQLLINKCEAGDARSCRDVSLLYELGNTVEKNPNRAHEYADKACTLGLQSACQSAPSTTKDSL